MMRLRFFNLIEITMAIAVVGIGIGGVMALFPPAIEANKVANTLNFTGNVVDNLVSYVRYKILTDNFASQLKEKSVAEEPSVDTDISEWTAIPNFSGIYTIAGKTTVFGVKSTDETISAHVRIWKAAENAFAEKCNKFYMDKTLKEIPISGREQYVVELSWPVAKPYADREKQLFLFGN